MAAATGTIDLTDVRTAAGRLAGHAAGYVAYRTIALGLRQGLFAALAEMPEPITAPQFAAARDLDPLYTRVWLRAAHAVGVLDLVEGGYVLPPAMATALLATDHGAHSGPLFEILHQPEIFDAFEERLATGDRLWWDDTSPTFIAAVAGTGRPFYNRLVPGGLDRVPGLSEVLTEGATVLELASGSGRGLERLADTYPNCRFVGVDGDAHSSDRARAQVSAAGVAGRVEIVHSTFEDFAEPGRFDVALINISMHECRDIDRVARNVHRSLRPDGVFVISDFPYPSDDDTDALRTPPGVLMSGIQFFEALIDDQLLPMHAYVELLERTGFVDVDVIDLSPVHALVHGRRGG